MDLSRGLKSIPTAWGSRILRRDRGKTMIKTSGGQGGLPPNPRLDKNGISLTNSSLTTSWKTGFMRLSCWTQLLCLIQWMKKLSGSSATRNSFYLINIDRFSDKFQKIPKNVKKLSLLSTSTKGSRPWLKVAKFQSIIQAASTLPINSSISCQRLWLLTSMPLLESQTTTETKLNNWGEMELATYTELEEGLEF